jgi:pimeloyl-ACP methyl ester carboxylesterase
MKARIFLFIICFSIFGISAKAQQVSAQYIDAGDSLKSAFLNAVEVDSLLYIEDVCPEIDTTGRVPLLLVHGWNFGEVPSPPSGGYWDYFKNYLKANPELEEKYKPYYVRYWSNYVSVPLIAEEFRRKIEKAGFHERNIVIVAHSMGGLVSRSYMEEQEFSKGIYEGQPCGEMVDLLITLGTPHHGSPMANGPARNAHYGFVMNIMLTIFEGAVFSETQYDDVNRSDLRWDNYDNLMDYDLYDDEKNLWLDSLNSMSAFYNKIICYYGSIKGDKNASTTTTEGQYKVGAYLMEEGFDFNNDGIVPEVSARFDGHQVKKLRYFEGYNHADLNRGIDGKRDELFDSLKIDLLEITKEEEIEVQIIQPYGGQLDVPLLPCFEVEAIEGATEYTFAYHPVNTQYLWAKSYTSGLNRFCVDDLLSEELTPGVQYQLSAKALVDNKWTKIDTVLFTAEASLPYDFNILSPVNGDSLETETITLAWNRAIGADNYKVKLEQDGTVFESALIENTDTTFELSIGDLQFYEIAGVIVYAINKYGQTAANCSFVRKYKTGVDRFDKSGVPVLAVYPNPLVVNKEAIIEFNTLNIISEAEISLFNLNGQCLFTKNITLKSGRVHRLNWTDFQEARILKAGAYILQIKTTTGISEIKVLVSD